MFDLLQENVLLASVTSPHLGKMDSATHALNTQAQLTIVYVD
jgi:hypothetical protein